MGPHPPVSNGHDLYSDDVLGVNICKEATFLRIHEPRRTHTDKRGHNIIQLRTGLLHESRQYTETLCCYWEPIVFMLIIYIVIFSSPHRNAESIVLPYESYLTKLERAILETLTPFQ